MSADIFRKLLGKYNGSGRLTSSQITRYLNDNSASFESRDPFESLIFGLRDKLGPVLDSEKKLTKFKGRVQKLIRDKKYTLSELSLIDISCVHQDGRIDFKELDWILENKDK